MSSERNTRTAAVIGWIVIVIGGGALVGRLRMVLGDAFVAWGLGVLALAVVVNVALIVLWY